MSLQFEKIKKLELYRWHKQKSLLNFPGYQFPYKSGAGLRSDSELQNSAERKNLGNYCCTFLFLIKFLKNKYSVFQVGSVCLNEIIFFYILFFTSCSLLFLLNFIILLFQFCFYGISPKPQM